MVEDPPVKSKAMSCLGLDLTKKQWLILAAMCSISITSGICVSLQGPIYPPQAEKKGASATEYGMVFGVFELVAFIACPLYGKYMDRMGSRNVLIWGNCIGGVSMILFGFLDLIETHLPFITLSFVFRILESVGSSAAFTASFSITAIVFAGRVATMYAIMECFYGLGFSLGPTIGSYLFEVGGFITPFLLVGVILLVNGFFLYFAVPRVSRQQGKTDETPTARVGILSVLKLPSATLDYMSIIVANISIGFNMATLEPHLRQFDLGTALSGAVFALMAIFYMLSTPVVGRLCDTTFKPKNIIITGTLLAIIGYSLVGPLPFLNAEPSLSKVIPGLAITGSGVSCLMVPGFIDAIKSSLEGGLPDHVNTYSVVSGLSTSSVYLGAFIGPTIAGVLQDAVGYRWGTLFVIAVNFLLFLAMVIFVSLKASCCSKATEEVEASKYTPTLNETCDTHKGKVNEDNVTSNDLPVLEVISDTHIGKFKEDTQETEILKDVPVLQVISDTHIGKFKEDTQETEISKDVPVLQVISDTHIDKFKVDKQETEISKDVPTLEERSTSHTNKVDKVDVLR